MATGISYNSNSLQTANIMTEEINHEDMPSDVAAIYKLAHASINTNPYPDDFEPKVINQKGTIIDDTIALLDTRLDTFRGYFTGTGKTLDIDYGGSTRRYYISKVNKCSITRPNGLKYANFDIDYITASYGQNVGSTTLLNGTGRTSSSYSDTVTFAGNAPYQKPIITITITAATGLTNKTITVGNNSNGQAISITRTAVVGDVYVIDSLNNKVQVNSQDVDFTGAFLSFTPGSATIVYSDNFTTRAMTENIIYYPQYL